MPTYHKNIEMLVEAISAYSGYNVPGSELYKARNPIGLRATSMKHAKDENGFRIFNSFLDGFQAALFDLSKKLSGNSWAQLTHDSTLEDLAKAYSDDGYGTSATAWAKYIRKAMDDDKVTTKTPLKYFLETPKDK